MGFTRRRDRGESTLVTIVLADPQDLVRSGIRCLLEEEADFKIEGEVADGLEAVRLVQRLKPRVLIVSLAMPGLNCLEITRQVEKHSPATAVIVLSAYSNEQYVLQALKNGASGYVMMYVKPAELVRAIRKVVKGHYYLSRPLSALPCCILFAANSLKNASRSTPGLLSDRIPAASCNSRDTVDCSALSRALSRSSRAQVKP